MVRVTIHLYDSLGTEELDNIQLFFSSVPVLSQVESILREKLDREDNDVYDNRRFLAAIAALNANEVTFEEVEVHQV